MTDTINLYVAFPRGFCAGVKRAISLVEDALAQHGTPIFVHHEIVHNRHVVETLKNKGVIFVENLNEVFDKSRPVIISAHGAAKEVYDTAQKLDLKIIDATCPLVEKVHKQIRRLAEQNKIIIVIGKAKHPEIIGTIGQIEKQNDLFIINSVEEVDNLPLDQDADVGLVTQTTLAVDEVEKIMTALKQKFVCLQDFKRSDICYATTHRQAAIKAISEKAEAVIVIGSKNSSNSLQLKKTALSSGAQKAWLIDDASELPWNDLIGVKNIGISAGASAPEILVQQVVDALRTHYKNLKIHDVIVAEESIEFKK